MFAAGLGPGPRRTRWILIYLRNDAARGICAFRGVERGAVRIESNEKINVFFPVGQAGFGSAFAVIQRFGWGFGKVST